MTIKESKTWVEKIVLDYKKDGETPFYTTDTRISVWR
jgi:hypothetical protein